MGKGERLFLQMRRNPAGDWTIKDIEVVCAEFGLTCRPPSRGSHYKVSHPDVPDILTVPARRPIKTVYIRRFVQIVESVSEDEA